jgi:actin family MreB-like protein
MNIVAMDIGFGDVKIYSNRGYSKEITAVARVTGSTIIQDVNYVDYKDKKYYVFKNAAKLPKDLQVDVENYEGLKFITPIIIKAYEKQVKTKIEVLAVGLSLSMAENSADYVNHISEECGIDKSKIFLLPQGVGCKISYDAYNLDFSDTSKFRDLRSNNYIGIDIGYNTVDVFQVIGKNLSSNTVTGLEQYGVVRVLKALQAEIKRKDQLDLDVPTLKEVLSTGGTVYRGKAIDYTEEIGKLVVSYLIDLLSDIESKFSDSINKMDNIILLGGGAALLKIYENNPELIQALNSAYGSGFVLLPANPEYYNVMGYHLYATKKMKT